MTLLLLYWSFLAIGYVISNKLKKKGITPGFVEPVMMGTIYIMCFIMGLKMGIDEQVTSNLGKIGIMAFVVTVFCIGGSMLFITLVRKLFHMNRHGDVIVSKAADKETHKSAADQSGEKQKVNLKSTLIIIGLVAVGMIAGVAVLKRMSGYIYIITGFSGYALTVLLCILMFFVGFNLAAAGDLLGNIKSVGIKALFVSIAAILGSAVAGTLSCMIMGMGIREGLAISLGFGWYTYAPVVIAGAGNQFIVAGAVSFMHNAIREISGIIFIPVLAEKTGYLEVTGIPGVAAMDICLPIVGHTCRQDTVVYSFAVGLSMCLVTSICVPLVMGV